MPRRVQDIVTVDRRSIRNIPLKKDILIEKAIPEKTRRKSGHESTESTTEKGRELPIQRIHATLAPKKDSPKKASSWIALTILIIGGIIGLAWLASVYFSKATFTITPKRYPVTINGTYIAQGTSSGTLLYELVTLTGSASTTVNSTDSPPVSTKAQGTVTLYNNNKDAQRLVAGTRLSQPDGTIYRLTDSVTIPARTTKPGTLVTPVVADKAGQESNLAKSSADFDLKAVGFKGTDKYDTVYARVATDIVGGFIGSRKVVSSETLASTSVQLANQITQELLERARASIPEDHIMYDNVRVTSFSQPQISGNDSSQATVSIQGTLVGILFNKTQLVERLAGKDAVEPFGTFAYNSPGLEMLDVSMANAKDFSPQKKNSLILRVKGDMELVGVIPVDEIRHKLAGVSLDETDIILQPYSPVIESGSGELIPPWSKVPTDIERISIVINEKSI